MVQDPDIARVYRQCDPARPESFKNGNSVGRIIINLTNGLHDLISLCKVIFTQYCAMFSTRKA
jgi:hypothetical protein